MLALPCKDGADEKRKSTNQKRLRKREEETAALELIVEHIEILETRRRVSAELQRIAAIHGDQQMIHVGQHGSIDSALIVSRILCKIFDTPRMTDWKTVGCLIRGTALPYTFAVSGYNAELQDGALSRLVWVPRVFQLADVISYELRAHDDLEDPEKLHGLPPPSISGLDVEICVCQPGTGNVFVCLDCVRFCDRIAYRFGFDLKLVGGNRTTTRVLHSLPFAGNETP